MMSSSTGIGTLIASSLITVRCAMRAMNRASETAIVSPSHR
ncbi:MAG: hypothetical protein ABI601_08350 [bacterium]